jgi:phosphatidylglycerol lysyltransferase
MSQSAATMANFPDANPALRGPQDAVENRFGGLRSLAAARRPLLVWFVTLVTLGGGLANLYFAVNPPHRPHRLLRELLPLEFLHYPRSFTLFIGLALVVSALNVYKRRRRAFRAVLALASLSFVLHLVKGHDYGQALLSLLLVGALWLGRRGFTVRSRQPDWSGILTRISVAAVVAFGYGAAGFWLLDKREFGINFNWADSIRRTLLYLSFVGDPALVPHTRYAAWFLDSLSFVTAAVALYAGFALFRPVLYRFRWLPHERARATEITGRHGRSALDFFKLWPDKSYFFNSAGTCFVAYRVGANFAVALGDPVGPADEIAATVQQFRQYCEDNGWAVAFHQTLPDFLPVYRRLGFKTLKLGDDAVVDLTDFNLNGRSQKKFRHKINRCEKEGVHLRNYAAPVPEGTLKQLKEVSDEWLRLPGRRERTFTVGLFDERYLRATPVVTAEDGAGRVLAFVNIVPSYLPGEATIDLMRHRADAPNGIMDYLFVKLILQLQAEGRTRFNLGMAPMDGFREHEQATAAERAVHLFFQRLTFLFSFNGLRQYKSKFASHWEPRYAVYRSAFDLPKLGIALGRVSELREGGEG